MKILVFSDSHGSWASMNDILRREDGDEVFFLGDGLQDVERLRAMRPDLSVTAVQGNCDRPTQPVEIELERQGVRIFLTHGHAYQVKQGLGGLVQRARRAGVQVALFGHTHSPLCRQEEGLWLLNPGSVGSVWAPNYGVILLENGAVTCYTDQSDK